MPKIDIRVFGLNFFSNPRGPDLASVNMQLSANQRRIIWGSIVLLAICIGLALRRDAFWQGLGSDDYLHFAMLEGVYPVQRSPLDLFNFYQSSEEVKSLRQFGTLPWLSDPNFRLAMLRPLSSALITLDYFFFGNNVYAFYLHSAFWWIIMLIAIALVLGEVLPMGMAATAVLLFAIDESSATSFFWLANRNGVISLGFGTLALWAHIRWRRHGYTFYFLLSLTLNILALLGGEWVFTIFAYIFAFEIFTDQKPIRSRVMAVVPLALLATCFAAMQSALHYGALHSSVYVNPFTDPLLFLSKAGQRIPIFFADMILGIPTVWWFVDNPWRRFFLSTGFFSPSVWRMMPAWGYWHISLGIIAIIVFIPLARWGIRAHDATVQRELRWLSLGSALALLPMVASIPSDRLTLPSAIGFSALVSAIIIALARRLRSGITLRPLRIPIAAAMAFLLVCWIQIYNAASRSIIESRAGRYLYESVARWIEHADIDDAEVERQRIVLINPVDHTTTVFLPFVRYAFGHPMPRSCWALSGAPFAHDITRTASNALEFSVLGANLTRDAGLNFYLDDRSLLKEGDVFAIDGLKVEILRITGNILQRFRFTFAKSLDDSSYLFLHSSRRGLRRFEMPAVGQTVRLARGKFPDHTLVPRFELRLRDPKRMRERFMRSGWFSVRD